MIRPLLQGTGILLGGLATVLPGCGRAQQSATSSTFVLDHTMTRLDGSSESLREYEGRVLLIVNVASKCGYTRQYDGLEALFQEKRDEGFAVLGFPSNAFLGQEPGTDAEIAEFCRVNFGVTFPMFSKIDVKGSDAHPLFQSLTGAAGAPSWNFNKYLVDRTGRVVARYGSGTEPDDASLREEIDRLLATDGA